MRKMFRIFVFSATTLAVLAGLPGLSLGQVLINELLPAPSCDWDGDGEYDSRNDEWVEIINAGGAAVDLAGYLLRDGGGTWNWRFGFSGVIDPGEVLVIYGSDSRAWEEANGFPVYGLSLNNAGDEVFLCRVIGGDTLTVDSIAYGRSVASDRSIGRSPSTGEWEIFDALNPCPVSCNPPGNGCVPTPGGPNACATAVQEHSWGAVKSLIGR